MSQTKTKLSFSLVPQKVPAGNREEILNILGDDRLTDLLIFLKSYGFIDFSDNIINGFEKEKEVKIYDIDTNKLIKQLEELGAQKYFEGKVVDTYYDTSEKMFDKGDEKRSFRIREKTDSEGNKTYYYTLKKKQKEETNETGLRTCFEKELKIENTPFFEGIIKLFGLEKTRRKKKKRIAYTLGNVKFDIDLYGGKIPPLLEIEADHTKVVEGFMKALGLNEKETSTGGSRTVFKKYGEKYETL